MTITFWGGLVQIILPIEWAVRDDKETKIAHGSKIHFIMELHYTVIQMKTCSHLLGNFTFSVNLEPCWRRNRTFCAGLCQKTLSFILDSIQYYSKVSVTSQGVTSCAVQSQKKSNWIKVIHSTGAKKMMSVCFFCEILKVTV